MEDVLRRCAHLLGLDEDEVLGSATLMHGTSVVTDLENDLEAFTTKFGTPPLPPPSRNYLSGVAFSVHVFLRQDMFVLHGVLRYFFSSPSGKRLARELNSLYGVLGWVGWGPKSAVRLPRSMS